MTIILSDISSCSSINKSYLVLNDSLSHKNVSFIKSVSNFNGDDQSSLNDVSLSVNADITHGFLLDYNMSVTAFTPGQKSSSTSIRSSSISVLL